MKILLWLGLAASLVANIALGLRLNRNAPPVLPAPTNAPAGVDPDIRSSAATNARAHSTAGFKEESDTSIPQWRSTPTSETDLRRLVADLRASGHPPAIIRAIVNALIAERFAERQAKNARPYWQGGQTPEVVAAQNAITRERQALFEAVLGDDGLPSAVLDPLTRERRYGSLPDAKLNAVAKIERDYNELTAEAWAQRQGATMASFSSIQEAQRLMEAEKLKDLAGILTPAELAEYERRNSTSARALINQLGRTEVTENEYLQLYQAQRAFDAANPPKANMTSTEMVQRQQERLAMNEKIRAVLGEARFYAFAEQADPNFRNAMESLGRVAPVTPAIAYQVYSLQLEAQKLAMRNPNEPPPSREKIQQLQVTMEGYNQKLDALLGKETADGYRKQPAGGFFRMFRSAPAATR